MHTCMRLCSAPPLPIRKYLSPCKTHCNCLNFYKLLKASILLTGSIRPKIDSQQVTTTFLFFCIRNKIPNQHTHTLVVRHKRRPDYPHWECWQHVCCWGTRDRDGTDKPKSHVWHPQPRRQQQRQQHL